MLTKSLILPGTVSTLISGLLNVVPSVAAASRATPQTLRQSGRFARISKSTIVSSTPRIERTSVPGA